MKDIQEFCEKQDILDFVNSQWQTEMFREAALTEGHPVEQLLQKFAVLPRIFFKFTEPSLERLHFTTWMGAMALRGADWYKNPYIADVFLLHEICHMANATYEINLSFDDWHHKMNMEEVDASVLSEVMVYFWMPDLRPLTFEQPIWADRFLNEDNHALFAEDPEALKDYIMRARLECMKETHKNSADPEVRRIAQYGFSNYEWSNIWQGNYREVEFRMTLLRYESQRNRRTAQQAHKAWLESRMENCIPFRAQAEAYAAHLDKVYGN